MVTHAAPDPLITVSEAAAYMRCSRVFLWKMRKEGRLASLAAGKKVLFQKSAIDSFLSSKSPSKSSY